MLDDRYRAAAVPPARGARLRPTEDAWPGLDEARYNGNGFAGTARRNGPRSVPSGDLRLRQPRGAPAEKPVRRDRQHDGPGSCTRARRTRSRARWTRSSCSSLTRRSWRRSREPQLLGPARGPGRPGGAIGARGGGVGRLGERGHAPCDAGKQEQEHQARAQGEVRPRARRAGRLPPALEEGVGVGHPRSRRRVAIFVNALLAPPPA